MKRLHLAALLAAGALVACGDDSGGGTGGAGSGGSPGSTTSTSEASTSAASTSAASTASGEGGEGVGGSGEGGEGVGGGGVCSPDGALDLSPCDPETGTFTIEIDNPYYPLPVGLLRTFEGIDEEDGSELLLEIEVLDEIEVVAGVDTRVLQEREYADGELVEISWNWFVQAEDGSVCYFGEDVDIYEEDGTIVHDGAWRAGDDGALPGIVMPGEPELGQVMIQEIAPGIAEDQATITAIGETVTTPFAEYTDTISMSECTPLEPGHISLKDYAEGIGMIVDSDVRLTDVQGL